MAQGLFDFKKIAVEVVEALASEGVLVERLWLYGSRARGTATEDSDIDLVVISRDLARFEPLERLQFLSKATWKCEGPLEVLGYTPDEVKGKEGKSIMWDEICKGRVIYDAAA